MNANSIINEYMNAQASGSHISRRLSEDFHMAFRQTIELAKIRGYITFEDPTPDFWEKLIESAPGKEY
jgi:hypothetical protein